jgi:hypothetical protein
MDHIEIIPTIEPNSVVVSVEPEGSRKPGVFPELS